MAITDRKTPNGARLQEQSQEGEPIAQSDAAVNTFPFVTGEAPRAAGDTASLRVRHVTGFGDGRTSVLLANYMVIAGATCIGLFFVLWWALHLGGDDTPWLPSGLIASIAMIGLVVTREIIMRRFETRSILHQRTRSRAARQARKRLGHTIALSAPLKSLRSLERRLVALDGVNAAPAQHLEAYRLCEKYLAQVAEALPRTVVEADVRAALRAGLERIRVLQKRHLLAWARKESQQITADAQRRTSIGEKISTAGRALDVLNDALRVYPGAAELAASAVAVREFIASVNVMHWVGLAEREVFKGRYEQAIDYYGDALFDLTRAEISEQTRREAAERITREVQLLRAHQGTTGGVYPAPKSNAIPRGEAPRETFPQEE